MILGMIENALGWHFDVKERNELLKKMKKVLNITPLSSNSGFTSLLQYHVKISDDLPQIKSSKSFHFDDLWSQQLKGASFIGGSKNYSYEAVPIMNAVRSKVVTTGDTAAMDKSEGKIKSFKEGDKIHNNVLRPYFPQYYSSPTQREYVVHDSVLPYHIESSDSLLALISDALNDPKAPLYLGSNDGWIEAQLMEESV